jgi:hypothetical protein
LRSLVAMRRVLIATAGATGILVLSGSQEIFPAAAAYLTQVPGPNQGQTQNKYAATSSALGSTPTPTSLLGLPPTGVQPSTAPSSSPTSTGPYGLTSTAVLTASGIPQPAYNAYVAAAQELAGTDPSCHLSWSIIAGIGRVESNHGRYGGSTILANGLVTPPIYGVRLDGSRSGNARITDTDNGKYDGDTSFDRAVGPMQFLPATWAVYGAGANPQNMNAAALATGRYLCAGNSSLATEQGRWSAVYRYNHSNSYADSYATGTTKPFPTPPSSTPPATTPPATTPGPPPAVPSPTPTPTPKPTPPKPTTSPTPKPSPSPTPTPKPTGTGTPSPSPTPSTTPTPTSKPTPSTSTPSPSKTPSGGSGESCATPTSTPTPTPTATPTPAPTPTCPK